MTKQYYILVRDANFKPVAEWVVTNNIPHELHLNRLRFRPNSSQLLVEFYLQYQDLCAPVELPYPSEF